MLEKPWPDFQPGGERHVHRGDGPHSYSAGLVDGLKSLVDELDAFCSKPLDISEQAQRVSEALAGRVPVLYSTAPLAETAARVCKIKLNENAKIPAFFNEFPEVNHNEMEGFRGLTAPYTAVILRTTHLSAAMARRVDATMATLDEAGVPSVELALQGATHLQQTSIPPASSITPVA